MVDYSKWKNLEMSDSEGSEDEGRPVVTKLDRPTSVTWGGTAGSQPVAHKNDTPSTAHALVPATKSEVSAKRPSSAVALEPKSLSKNGGEVAESESNAAYIWIQSRHDVTIAVVTPSGTKAPDVKVRLDTRPSSNDPQRLRVWLRDATLLDTELTHPVEPLPPEEDISATNTTSEDGTASRTVDWELRDLDDGKGSRCVLICLVKRSPIPGAVLWWKSAFKGDPEIDLESIQGRSASGSAAATAAWDEAQASFRERVAHMKANKREVDIG